MNGFESFSYGDGRINAVCRAAGLAFVQTLGNSVRQLDKDLFMKDGQLYCLRAGNTTHLTGQQCFWGALNPRHHAEFVKLATERNARGFYVLIAPNSPRVPRGRLARSNHQRIPKDAGAWVVPIPVIGKFLEGKTATEAGYIHTWVLGRDASYFFSSQGTSASPDGPDISKYYQSFGIPDAIRKFVEAGNGIYGGRKPTAAKETSERKAGAGKIDVNLSIGDMRIIGTLNITRTA